MSTELAELEIGRFEWATMRCGCGKSAGHLAEDLRGFITGFDPRGLGDHVLPAGEVLVEPSLPTLGVLLAALTGDLPDSGREMVYHLLLGLVGDNAGPVEQFRAKAREGLWLFYAEVLTGTSRANAFEILEIIEEDQDRVERLRAAAADRLPWDLRTKRDD